MEKPRICNENWAMTMTYTDSYGEELWTVIPKRGNWIAVIHLQPSGKLFLTIMKEGKSSSNRINQEMIVDALQQLSQKVYEERNILCQIGVPARERNAKLFSTVRKAGFHRTSERVKIRRKPATIIFRYIPKEKESEIERTNKEIVVEDNIERA